MTAITAPPIPKSSECLELMNNLWVHNSPSIPDFAQKVKKDLSILSSKPVGERLITRIQAGKHPILICFDQNNNGIWGFNLSKSMIRGEGCGALINYNPELKTPLFDLNGNMTTYPSWTSLAHELIHGYHFQQGKNYVQKPTAIDKETWTDPEEYHTIMGFPSKNPKRDPNRAKITQYAIHKEHGLIPRFGHKALPQTS